jgi:molecular chaperone GrpE (heat shock protein)
MSEPSAPGLKKWPFLVGDVLLLGVAAWLALRPGPHLALWHDGFVVGCVALGAWLAALPFLVEHRTAVQLAEASGLASTVGQIKGLQTVGEQVAAATARWQAVQEAAGQTARTAREITDQITAEARNFADSMQKARDAEVRHLRLEVEKFQRAERDWLQVLVRVLDHVYALHSAGLRSGQPALAAQLTQFQNACRDATRRIGLTPLEAVPGAPFDEQLHQLAEGTAPTAGAVIGETLATGYSYQGQQLRRSLVTLRPGTEAEAKPSFEEGEGQLPLQTA